ncbi:MAG: tyrosine--tRNA ligase [Candidatus Micrarchaeota archaeon]|nr:tyrosine--tRNA ligase [Candidatus Micrarchaeota archaeon]
MDLERKIELVKRTPTEEIITDEDLKHLFETNAHPKHYIGFEISGMVHIGTGLVTTAKINDFIEAGVKPTIFLADYHAWLNGKLGGDLEKIQKVAKGYFKGAFISLGLDESKVNFVLASEIYNNDYWKIVLDVSINTTLARMMRCTTIMGRKEGDACASAHIVYPAMQAADIFFQDLDIVHAGMDQRKVHMLVRELAPKLKMKKPVAVHTRLLTSLQGPGRMDAIDKMSKSKPETCIFIHDSEADLKKKISNAYCPPKEVAGNPIIEIAETLLMRNASLKIERPQKFGGDVEFANAAELKTAFSEGKLHPADLKNSVSSSLSKLLEPSRKYFEKNKELLTQVS